MNLGRPAVGVKVSCRSESEGASTSRDDTGGLGVGAAGGPRATEGEHGGGEEARGEQRRRRGHGGAGRAGGGTW